MKGRRKKRGMEKISWRTGVMDEKKRHGTAPTKYDRNVPAQKREHLNDGDCRRDVGPPAALLQQTAIA
jgi:hypothetical protein